jgi:hypothetical protein
MKYVIGPDGSPLTLADLPAPGTTRWVIRRKAEIVAAVDAIPLGVNFIKVLRDEVAECDALLASIGPNWLQAS